MFEKLNVEYDLNLIESFKGEVAASYNNHFVEYQITDYDELLSVLMEKLEFTILPSKMRFTTIRSLGTLVHCDAWQASINIYLSVNEGDVTHYYKDTNDFVLEEKQGGKKVKIFNSKSMVIDRTFVADKGDCYLLNTQIPHDVRWRPDGTSGDRDMLRIIWDNNSYDEIRRSIILK